MPPSASVSSTTRGCCACRTTTAAGGAGPGPSSASASASAGNQRGLSAQRLSGVSRRSGGCSQWADSRVRAVSCPGKTKKIARRNVTPVKPQGEQTAGTSQSPPLGVHERWNRWDWAAGYRAGEDHPDGYWLEVSEGALPPDLQGTFLRNGPGRLDVGGRDRVAHPFDADGMVVSIAISEGKAFFRSRYIDTSEVRMEKEAGKRLFRGSFGTQRSGGFWSNFLELAPRNAANTNILCWGQHCLALFEAGQPYRLNPYTLETEGLDTLDGVLKVGLPFSANSSTLDSLLQELLDSFGVSSALPGGTRLGGDAFSAHPHLCPHTGRLVSYSYSIKLRCTGLQPSLVTVVTLYEFDDDLNLVSSTDYTLDGYAFMHDFQVTEGHYVVIQNPVHLDLVPFLMGTKSPVECVKFMDGETTKIHLIERPDPGQLCQRHMGLEAEHITPRMNSQAQPSTVLEVDNCFVFHISNAHEEPVMREDGSADTQVTVDCVRYPEMPDFEDLMGHGAGFEYVRPEVQPKSELWRMQLQKNAGASEFWQISEKALEFPTCAPGISLPRFTYAAAAIHPCANMPQQEIARIDMETGAISSWTRGDRYYVGEPQFVPRADAEGCGWLVAMCFNAAKDCSEFIVLDVEDIEAGPVAVCRVSDPVPHGLHGQWLDAYLGPAIA